MFGKKTTADELLKLFSALSDEEKQKFLGVVNGDNDEESAPAGEPEAEDGEQPKSPVEGTEEQTGEPAAPTEGSAEDTPANEQPTEAAPVEDAPADEAPTTPDAQAADNTAAILEGFGTRLTAIEGALKGLTELKELMENYTQAQADKFGYNGTIPGGKKDYKEMSADELRKEILTGGN